MNAERTMIWIQVATGIAVVAGLGLVIWELQQVKTLSRAQLTSDYIAASSELGSTVLGENPSEVLAKACNDPANLTMGETRILSTYYMSRLLFVARAKALSDRDGVYSKDYWRTIAAAEFPQLFDTSFGRVWFLQQRPEWYGEGIIQTGLDHMKQLGPPWCASAYSEQIEGVQYYRNAASEMPIPAFEPLTHRIDRHLNEVSSDSVNARPDR